MTIELIVVGIVTLLAGFLIARVVLKKGLNEFHFVERYLAEGTFLEGTAVHCATELHIR